MNGIKYQTQILMNVPPSDDSHVARLADVKAAVNDLGVPQFIDDNLVFSITGAQFEDDALVI